MPRQLAFRSMPTRQRILATPVGPLCAPSRISPSLPPDLAEAFENFKLTILRHKVAGWTEVSRDDVLAVLDALRHFACAPS